MVEFVCGRITVSGKEISIVSHYSLVFTMSSIHYDRENQRCVILAGRSAEEAYSLGCCANETNANNMSPLSIHPKWLALKPSYLKGYR